MECVIPLSLISKLDKYGVKLYKPYNDARKLLPEKYHLEIVEDEKKGKGIRIRSEEDFRRFIEYFIEELLQERSAERYVYEGLPFDKYEKLTERVVSLERELAKKEKELEAVETTKYRLEKEIKSCQQQVGELTEENQTLYKKLREHEKAKKVSQLQNEIERLTKLLEHLPKEDSQVVKDTLQNLKELLSTLEKE